MPTGYTSDLYEGDQTFPEFVMGCARAFGALIEMRDLPPDAPIPEAFAAPTYHAERLASAEAAFERAAIMTDEEAQVIADDQHAAAVARIAQARRDVEARRARYEDMLARVEAWEPPTPDHVEMKQFMLTQLNQSIDFDCSTTYLTVPDRMTGAEFRCDMLAKVTRDMDHHRAKQREDEERAAGRTKWVQALRDSLSTEAVAP